MGPRRSKRRKSGESFRQATVIVTVGAILAGGLFFAGDYVVRQEDPAAIRAFMDAALHGDTVRSGAAATAQHSNDDQVYTGSILYLADHGNSCRQLMFDNRNGHFTDNGYIDCLTAEAQSGIGSPKQMSVARVKVISAGFHH